MTKTEIIEYIDKTLEVFEEKRQLELEEFKADLISDFYIFDIEFRIAQFAIANKQFVKIKGYSLDHLIKVAYIEDENGIDISISELISNWIYTTSKSIVYDFVQQDIPKPVILEVINYYENKINNNSFTFSSYHLMV